MEQSAKMHRKRQIFQTHVDDVDLPFVLGAIERALQSSHSQWIATVNPEILLHARRSAEYTEVLEQALLRVPDGAGLQYAAGVRNRVTGVELTWQLLELAARQGYPVLCVTWKYGRSSAAQIVQALEHTIHPDLISVVEIEDRTKISEEEWKFIDDLMIEFAPRVVFCGLGFPYQEGVLQTLVERCMPDEQDAALLPAWIGLGNGGALDYLTGTQKNPPQFLRKLGLEWFWRLVTQPNWRRFTRIWNAVIVFPLFLFSSQFMRMWKRD